MKTYTFKVVHKFIRSQKTKIPLTINQKIKAESLFEANELIRKQFQLGLYNVYCIAEK
jgi:hypothetical protein